MIKSKKIKHYLFLGLIVVLIVGSVIMTDIILGKNNTLTNKNAEIQQLTNELQTIKDNYDLLQEEQELQQEQITTLEKENNDLKEITDKVKIEVLKDSEYKILAKLLFREAGTLSWDGQVYTCSAILNLRDYTGKTINQMAHDKSMFSVAPIVDSAKPTKEIYKVIDYVLDGNRVPEICYFRTRRYHSFGVPVCKVDKHYFSRLDVETPD